MKNFCNVIYSLPKRTSILPWSILCANFFYCSSSIIFHREVAVVCNFLADYVSGLSKYPTDLLGLMSLLTVLFTVLVRGICSLKVVPNVHKMVNYTGSISLFYVSFAAVAIASIIAPELTLALQALLAGTTLVWLIYTFFVTDRHRLGLLVLQLGFGFVAMLLLSAPLCPASLHPLAKVYLAFIISLYGPLFCMVQEDAGFLPYVDLGYGAISNLFIAGSLTFSMIYAASSLPIPAIILLIACVVALHRWFTDLFIEALILFGGLLALIFIGISTAIASILPLLVVG